MRVFGPALPYVDGAGPWIRNGCDPRKGNKGMAKIDRGPAHRARLCPLTPEEMRNGVHLDVRTWADGYGVWHVRVPSEVGTPGDTASRALRDELIARESAGTPVPPEVYTDPVRVPDLDDDTSTVYRERFLDTD